MKTIKTSTMKIGPSKGNWGGRGQCEALSAVRGKSRGANAMRFPHHLFQAQGETRELGGQEAKFSTANNTHQFVQQPSPWNAHSHVYKLPRRQTLAGHGDTLLYPSIYDKGQDDHLQVKGQPRLPSKTLSQRKPDYRNKM